MTYLSPKQVAEMVPGLTVGNLKQLRHKGGGPIFRRASERVIVYDEADVHAWLAERRFERTDRKAPKPRKPQPLRVVA